LKNRVFWGGKGQDPEQSKDLETRIKKPCGTPKYPILCENPLAEFPNFGWRVVAKGFSTGFAEACQSRKAMQANDGEEVSPPSSPTAPSGSER